MLCKTKEVRIALLTKLNELGKEAKLQSFEQAKNIHLDTVPFMNNGLINPSMKILRHIAKVYYATAIQDMYKEGMLPLPKGKK